MSRINPVMGLRQACPETAPNHGIRERRRTPKQQPDPAPEEYFRGKDLRPAPFGGRPPSKYVKGAGVNAYITYTVKHGGNELDMEVDDYTGENSCDWSFASKQIASRGLSPQGGISRNPSLRYRRMALSIAGSVSRRSVWKPAAVASPMIRSANNRPS